MGNAISARLENVRAKDIEISENSGDDWVLANSGGISTFSVRGSGKNWWKLVRETSALRNQGSEIPNELRVINDYGEHWLWEPNYSMLLVDYRWALKSVGDLFYKVS